MVDNPTQNAEPDWFMVAIIAIAVTIAGYCYFTLGCVAGQVETALVKDEDNTSIVGDNAQITNVYNKSDYGVVALATGMGWALLRSRRRTKALDRMIQGINAGIEHDLDGKNIAKWINTNGVYQTKTRRKRYDLTEKLIHSRVKAQTNKTTKKRKRK